MFEDYPGRDDEGGASVLPALAEVHRRAGRPDEAEEVARRGLEFEPSQAEARVVLALALLDLDRAEEAREVLEPLTEAMLTRHGLDESDTPPPTAGRRRPTPVSDDELERAFEQAEPERDRMLDADEVAQQAIRAADRELERERPAPPFATRTVADLLERQGDPEGARQIRDALESQGGERPRRQRREIAELERWLANLRRAQP